MRSYHVTTFGCQMNAHDSERITGMLEELGIGEARDADEADVRRLQHLHDPREARPEASRAPRARPRRSSERDPAKVIAVGGCFVEAQRERLFSLYPWVDVAFGPGRIPTWASGSARGGEGVAARRVRASATSARFAGGCRSTASATPGVGADLDGLQHEVLVLHRAGGARARGAAPAADIVAEVERARRDGVREVTLLGQNVNSYGRELPPTTASTSPSCCARVDAVDGIDRIRYTSPHPTHMRDAVIAAMAECDVGLRAAAPAAAVGLDARAQGDAAHLLARALPRLVDELRAAIPDIALTTDIIVGFPGETEAEFLETV